jgi:Protein of unknown function (DUF4239)
MSTVLLAIIVVSLAVLAALAGLALVYRLLPPERRELSNSVGGILFIPISGLFSVLAAFMIGLGWQQYDNAHLDIQREVNALSAIYWHADTLPQPNRQRIQELAQSYAQATLDEEWTLMAQGEDSTRAWSITDDLQDSVDALEPSTTVEQTRYGQLIAQVENMLDQRRLRLLASREGLPPILWVVLLGLGMLLISFTYLFGMKRFWVHALMVGAVTAAVSLSLFTVYSLEYPFSDPDVVSAEPFEKLLEGFEAQAERQP